MTEHDDLHAIERLKYRYARTLDTKDWDGLAACFAKDATASYSGGQLTFTGREQIIGFLRETLGGATMITSHVMSQPEITLTSDTTAEGIWALNDLVLITDAGLEVRGAAFYEDRYIKSERGWLFSHTGYRRVYEQMAPRPADASITALWWENEGRSSLVER